MIFYFSSCPMLRPRPQWEAWPCEEPGRNCARRSASTDMELARCPIVPHGRGVKPFQAVRLEVLYSETCCFVDALYRGRSEAHTSEIQSLMRISYDVYSLKTKTYKNIYYNHMPV